MGLQPGADGLHGDVLAGDSATVDQHLADGGVGSSGLAGKGEANSFAVFQRHAAGALDMQEESVNWVVQPDDRLAIRIVIARLDLRAGGEDDARPAGLGKTPRRAKDGRLVRAMACQRAAHDRLVIAGEKRIGPGFGRKADGREPTLEKGPGGGGVRIERRTTGRLPVARFPVDTTAAGFPVERIGRAKLQDARAGPFKGQERGALIVRSPPGQIAEGNRMKAARARLCGLGRAHAAVAALHGAAASQSQRHRKKNR